MERPHVTDEVIGADQKIPDWLVETTFLVKFEIAFRLGIKSKLCTIDFIIQVMPFGACGFLLNATMSPVSAIAGTFLI